MAQEALSDNGGSFRHRAICVCRFSPAFMTNLAERRGLAN